MKISWSEKLGYGMGGLTVGIIMCLGNYLTVYLTNVALLDIAAVTTILAASRILDAISDIMVGNLIDSTKTIHGKARVWIRRASLPLAVSVVLLFCVPGAWPEGVKYVYIFLMYNLFTSVFCTFFIISHNALLSLMTSESGELRQISSIAAFFLRAGLMAISAAFVKLLMVFTDEPGNPMTQKGFICVVTIIGCLMAVLCLTEFYLTKEKVDTGSKGSFPRQNIRKTETLSDSSKSSGHDGKAGFRANLKQLLSNKYWIMMLAASLVAYAAGSCFDSSMSYYTLYILEDFEAMSLFHLVTGMGVIATTIILIAVGTRIQTSKLFIGSLIIHAAGIAGIYFADRDNRPLIIASLAIVGMGTAALNVSMPALVTEILIFTRKKGGELIPGLGNAGMNAARKLGLGLSMAVFGFVMSAAGFDAGLDAQGIPQPDSVISAVKISFLWVPFIFNAVLAMVFLLFFDMEKNEV